MENGEGIITVHDRREEWGKKKRGEGREGSKRNRGHLKKRLLYRVQIVEPENYYHNDRERSIYDRTAIRKCESECLDRYLPFFFFFFFFFFFRPLSAITRSRANRRLIPI